jgi:hypothetical protein
MGGPEDLEKEKEEFVVLANVTRPGCRGWRAHVGWGMLSKGVAAGLSILPLERTVSLGWGCKRATQNARGS